MGTQITQASGSSSASSVPVRRPTDAEMAMWKYCERHEKTKAGIWLDASSDWLYRNGGPADDPAAFQLIDRIGNRRFKTGLAAKHPIVVTDQLTGKPALMFGGGGAAPNQITAASDLECPSILANAVETNRLPLLTPGTGYSIAWAQLAPTPETTYNGVAWGATTGGSVLGGSAQSPDAAFWGVTFGTGIIHAHNSGAASASAAVTAGTTNYCNSTWLKCVATYDATLARVQLWVGSADAVPFVKTSMLPMTGTADAMRPRIAGIGLSAVGERLIGMAGGLIYLPEPILDDPTARTAAFAWLTERTM